MTTVSIQESIYIKHNWSDCPIKDVSFLRDKHIHKMFITVEVIVQHLDRQVEFFVLRSDLLHAIDALYPIDVKMQIYDLGQRSMEMVAKDLFDILCNCPYNVISVTCSEDGFFSGKYTA